MSFFALFGIHIFFEIGKGHYLALINRAGGLYGRILTEVASTVTERSVVCTSYRGQDSPILTDLARLITCLLHGQKRKQRNKNINNFICLPARAQAFSWLSSVTGLQPKLDENNRSKSSFFVQTSSSNEDKIFHTGSMKKLVVETTIYEK